MIEWCRTAEPQPDQYDTRVALRLAENNPLPNFRRFSPKAPKRGSLLDGQVELPATHECGYDGFENAPPDHPNIAPALELLRLWPEAFEQFRQLISYFNPIYDPQDTGPEAASCSGGRETEFGLIYATVEHPMTLAEAIVHETAHQKLFALGVGLEGNARILTNDPADLFESPVIRYRPRPMSAVLHAQFSFVHIVELDLRMLAHLEPAADPRRLLALLSYSLVRIEAGLEEVGKNAQTDRDGAVFLEAFFEWNDRVIEEANRALTSYRYPKPELPPMEYVVL